MNNKKQLLIYFLAVFFTGTLTDQSCAMLPIQSPDQQEQKQAHPEQNQEFEVKHHETKHHENLINDLIPLLTQLSNEPIMTNPSRAIMIAQYIFYQTRNINFLYVFENPESFKLMAMLIKSILDFSATEFAIFSKTLHLLVTTDFIPSISAEAAPAVDTKPTIPVKQSRKRPLEISSYHDVALQNPTQETPLKKIHSSSSQNFSNKSSTLEPKIYSFTCPECDRTLSSKFSLRRHMKTHTGKKPFICSWGGQCNNTFFEKEALKRHIRSHTKEKPYKCNYDGCTQRYADKVNLKRHKHKKHRNIPISTTQAITQPTINISHEKENCEEDAWLDNFDNQTDMQTF